MSSEQRIQHHLAYLYGARTASQVWDQLCRLLDEFQHRNPSPAVPQPPLSEQDAILITYGDTFQEPGRPPLQTLARFLDEHLAGVFSGVHLLPFFPFSSDDGFSVIDYRSVNPALGTWDDIRRLGQHRRLMFDAVINHVSRHSAWFEKFLRGLPEYQDYFIVPGPGWNYSRVVRPRTLPLLTRFETCGGPRSVLTTFSDDQIDLNYANPQVLLEILALLLFYVEQGASILRLDAIAYLWKEPGTSCIHLPQTHAVIKLFRAVLDLVAPGVLLLTETNVPHLENISYFGALLDPVTGRTDEAQMVYQFPLAPLVLHTLAAGDAGRLSCWAADLEAPAPFFNFLASHDGIGVLPARGLLSETEIAALVAQTLAHGGQVSYRSNPDGSQSPYELNITFYDAVNDPAHPDPELDRRRFLASQAIMLSLAGVPGVYVHSLFGSHNCQSCYAETGRARSLNRARFDYPWLVGELAQPESHPAQVLAAYRCLLEVRRTQPAFHPRAPQQVLSLRPEVFAVAHRPLGGGPPVLCLINVTAHPIRLTLDLAAAGLPTNAAWEDLLGSGRWLPSGPALDVQLDSYQTLWLASHLPLPALGSRSRGVRSTLA